MPTNQANRSGKGELTLEMGRSPRSRNLGKITTLVTEDNRKPLERIFEKHLKQPNRAAQDFDDFVQNTLRDFLKAMPSDKPGEMRFPTRQHIRNWLSVVGVRNAIKLYWKVGPAMRRDTLVASSDDQPDDGPDSFLDRFIDHRQHRQITPDIQVMDQEIRELAAQLRGEHGQESRRGRRRSRHPPGGGQTGRRQARLRALASALGGRTLLRLAGARFRRLARDHERLSTTLVGLHWLAFACLLLSNLFRINPQS